MRRGVYSHQSIQHALRAMPELRSGLLLLSAWLQRVVGAKDG